MNRTRAVAALLVGGVLVGCGGAVLRNESLDEMDRVRASAGAQEGARLAPEPYARAEQERDIARRAHQAGDEVGASLHAERAVAAYGHALTVARLARATAELADAQKTLDDATVQDDALEASRARLEKDAAEIEQRVRVARERLLPASSGPSTPERENARIVAARSLAMQARLLCGAARLAAPDASGLREVGEEVDALDERLAKNPRPVPIDDAARARTHCLDLLTRARRGTPDDAGAIDGLLAELSAAGAWDPVRDERGVVVTLHDIFRGAELAPGAEAKLKDLGRVAAAHPSFAVQVVVHDATAPASGRGPGAGATGTTRTTGATDATGATGATGSSGADAGPDARRAEGAVHALVAGGANAARIQSELAGARAPLVDPADAKGRARNERLDVVFVSTPARAGP